MVEPIRRIVVLELPGADPGQRMLEKGLPPFPHQILARLPGPGFVLLELTMLPSRAQNHPGMNGVPASIADDGGDPDSGAHLARPDDEHDEHGGKPEQSASRLREENRRHHQRGYGRRDHAAAGASSRERKHDRERHECHHVHGKIVGIAHQPRDRPVQALTFDQVVAGDEVEHAAQRDVADRAEDEPGQPSQRPDVPDAVDHQDEHQHDLEVDVGERVERAAWPDRERNRRRP